MVKMKGGSSGTLLFSGVFIMAIIIGVFYYISIELEDCPLSERLTETCSCNKVECSDGKYCNNKGSGVCESNLDLCYTSTGYKYAGQEYIGVKSCNKETGEIESCKTGFKLNGDKCDPMTQCEAGGNINIKSVNGFVENNSCIYECNGLYDPETGCEGQISQPADTSNPCLVDETCHIDLETNEIIAGPGYFLNPSDNMVYSCSDAEHGIPNTSSSRTRLRGKQLCTPDDPDQFTSCVGEECSLQSCNIDGGDKYVRKSWEERNALKSSDTSDNQMRDQNCSISSEYCKITTPGVDAVPGSDGVDAVEASEPSEDIVNISEGEECILGELKCKEPDYMINPLEGGDKCIRNEACIQCSDSHTIFDYQAKFTSNDGSDNLQTTLKKNGFMTLLHDDGTTLNPHNLGILKNNIRCVEGGKCEISIDGSSELCDSNDPTRRFNDFCLGLKQDGINAPNKLKIDTNTNSVKVVRSPCYTDNDQAPLGLGCVSDVENERSTMFPNTGGDYYFYDIQGKRVTTGLVNNDVDLHTLCSDDELTCNDDKSLWTSIIGEKLSEFMHFVGGQWTCHVPVNERLVEDGKTLCAPKNQCRVANDEGELVDYCKNYDQEGQDIFYEGGTLDKENPSSLADSPGCKVVSTGPSCICKHGFSHSDTNKKQCDVKDTCSPHGIKNPEWNEDEAEEWLKGGNDSIKDADGNYSCGDSVNCNLYGSELLNFENGKYFSHYLKPTGEKVHKCNWNSDKMHESIPCLNGHYIDTMLPEGTHPNGISTRCVPLNERMCSQTGLNNTSKRGQFFNIHTPKCNIKGLGGVAGGAMHANSECCSECNKKNKSNKTPTTLTQYNNVNKNPNNELIDLSDKDKGYNTRPTFYAPVAVVGNSPKDPDKYYKDTSTDGAIKLGSSKKIKNNLFTCIPTDKHTEWGKEPGSKDDLRYWTDTGNKWQKAGVKFNHGGYHYVNEWGKNCAHMNGHNFGSDKTKADNFVGACNDGVWKKINNQGVETSHKCTGSRTAIDVWGPVDDHKLNCTG